MTFRTGVQELKGYMQQVMSVKTQVHASWDSLLNPFSHVQFPEFPSPVLTHMWWSWSQCALRGRPCRWHSLSGSWWRQRWWLSGSLAQETAGIRQTVSNTLSEAFINTNIIQHLDFIIHGIYEYLSSSLLSMLAWAGRTSHLLGCL